MLRSRILLFFGGWLILTTAAYALILTSERRGSGMDGALIFLLTMLVGGAALLAAIVSGILSAAYPTPGRVRSIMMCLALAASCAGVLPVLHLGRQLYRQDLDEAKRFLEQRMVEARSRHDAGQPWPANPDELVAGHSLPRILRGKRFHIEQSDEHVEITIPVDFDKAFIYNSHRGFWHLSS